MDPSKVDAIVSWPTPTCVKHIQQFLGMCNYYNRFIHKYATISAPLSDLLGKNVPWEWSER